MAEQGTPRAVTPEEDARTGATPATFANKLYITPIAGGGHTYGRPAAIR